MPTKHVKKGDQVVVIAGASRGKRGRVIEVLPRANRVIVEGLQMIKKHMKRSQKHPEGQIVTREGTIHLSNVMRADRYDEGAAKRGQAAPAQA